MQLNPILFPEDEAHFLLTGPAGQLEVKAVSGTTDSINITVIVCHPHPLFAGTMENKVVTTLYRSFRDLGARVVRFNYRGVGKSDGEYGAAIGEADDLLAVCEWIRTVRPTDEIWLAGFSFGSYVVTRVANQVNAQQLLTVAPAVENFDFDSIAYPECPWLVIQGTADEVVPPDLVFSWLEKQANPPELIKYEAAGHFFHGRLTDLKETIIKYYQSYFS